MQPSDYLLILRRRWLTFVIMSMLGVGGGVAATLTATPQYRATAIVFFSLSRGNSVSELVQGSTYTQNLVQSYARLATMPYVLDPVIEELHLSMSPMRLAGNVKADAPLETVLIEISVTDPSPDTAALIANAVGVQVRRAVGELSPVGIQQTATIQVTTVSPAQVPRAAVSPNRRMNLLLGLAAGLLLATAVAASRELLAGRRRIPDELAEPSPQGVIPRTLDVDALGLEPALVEQTLVEPNG